MPAMSGTRRPNLVIFNPDQWRGDALGFAGDSGARTPRLDATVAGDGVGFTRAFCQNTVCTPSRCSFMTGWYPHVAGHRTMFHMLHDHEPLLLDELKKAGYRVWWGGKNDLIPGQHGWERAADAKHRPADLNGPNTHRENAWRGDPDGDRWFSFHYGRIETPEGGLNDGDWAHVRGAIEEIRHGPKDRPFCIFLPISFPHPPYACEEPFFSAIDRDAVPPRAPEPDDWTGKPALLRGIRERQRLHGWSEERWRELRAVYYAMCHRVDHQWGLLVDALKEAGVYDDTAMFCFSDHGDYTGDYGIVEKTQNTFEDALARVPLIVKPPKDVPVKPRATDALVELIDFTATVYDLAGIEPEYTQFGRSLRACLAGEDVHRDAVFCEGGRLHGELHAMELQSTSSNAPGEGLYWPRIAGQIQDDGPDHGKATMCRTARYKYVRRLYEDDEFYDLEADPRERDNRIHDPTCRDEILRHKERMLTWYQATCDVVPWEDDARNFTTDYPRWRDKVQLVGRWSRDGRSPSAPAPGS